MVPVPAVRCLLLVLWVVSSCCTGDNSSPDGGDPAAEWDRLSRTASREAGYDNFFGRSAHSHDDYNPPESMVVSEPQTLKSYFKPDNRTRALDPKIRNMLLHAKAPPPTAAPPRKQIEVLCPLNGMYVRIRRDIFTQNVAEDLRVGKCKVTRVTNEHYYFYIYLNQDCGIQKEFQRDFLKYHTNLVYQPTGLIIRDLPFTVFLECKFPKYFHSFKRGFHPIVRGRTYYKRLRAQLPFSLSTQDVWGNLKTTFTLSQLIQFEARVPSLPESQKLYINKCFMTPSQDPTLRHTIIDNYGCMIDSKESPQSMFVAGNTRTSQKFTVSAFIFNMPSYPSNSQNLTMHCQLALGSPTPSEVTKACMYDFNSTQWIELHGPQYNSVCACCDTFCSQTLDDSQSVASDAWKVDVLGRNYFNF